MRAVATDVYQVSVGHDCEVSRARSSEPIKIFVSARVGTFAS